MREPTVRQLQAMSFVILLSPTTRLIPGAAARAAGNAGWLCPVVAAPVCAAVALIVTRAMRNRAEGEGLGEVVVRAFPRFGRAVLLLYGLWLALYAGFAVRSGASRFIYTIYTGSSPWPFVAVGLLTALAAALGSVKRLARSAEIFRPLLLLTLVPILGFGLAQMEFDELLPVSVLDAPGVAVGALEVLGTVSFVLVNVPFLETGTPVSGRGRSMAAWSVRECLLLVAAVAAVIGRFGPELTASLTYPFFALVRNTGLLGVSERIEALVTGLWVLSDFVLCAFALMAASGALRLALGIKDRDVGSKLLRPRTLTTLACTAAALACALAIAPNSRDLRIISDEIIVYVNLAMLFAVLLPVLIAGCARRRM